MMDGSWPLAAAPWTGCLALVHTFGTRAAVTRYGLLDEFAHEHWLNPTSWQTASTFTRACSPDTVSSMAPDAEFNFSAEVWEHIGPSSWFFVSLPEDVADDIDERFGHNAAGFGSVRVEVIVGASCWRTSVFPDNKRATYVLPMKRAIRAAEGLHDGSLVDVSLSVLTDDAPRASRI